MKKKPKRPDSIQYLDLDKPTLWYIEWKDHCTHDSSGWHEQDNAAELTAVTILAIGWITQEDDERIVVCNNIDPDGGSYLHAQCILKSCIAKAVKLEDQFNWQEIM